MTLLRLRALASFQQRHRVATGTKQTLPRLEEEEETRWTTW